MVMDPAKQEKCELLVIELKKRTMKAREMFEVLGMRNLNKHSYTILQDILLYIGNKYPIYEPVPGQYKILTDKDLEEYQKQERSKNNA